MSEYFNDVMVDIETTGLDPSHSHILQIAAVRFNLEEQTIDTSEMFDRCLWQTTPNRFWDPGTRDWWMGQKASVLQDIIDRGEQPAAVMAAFEDFLIRTRAEKPLRFWCKPLSFDWPFIQSYVRQFDRQMICHYRHAKDLNTYIYAKGHTDIDAFWKGIHTEGDKHNAIFDCIHQIHGLFQATRDP